MEALVSAYATSSGDDDGDEEQASQKQSRLIPEEEHASNSFIGPREAPELRAPCISSPPPLHQQQQPLLPTSPPPAPAAATNGIIGRYVSKRERAQAGNSSSADAENTTTNAVAASIHNVEVPLHMRKKLKQFTYRGFRSQLPKGLYLELKGHTKAVTAVRWSPTHESLLASAGMDGVVHIWNVWTQKKGQQGVGDFSSHRAAVKDLQWSQDGSCVLTCGFDQTSRLTDVETGCEKQVLREDQYITVVKYHPFESELFLSGGSKGIIRLWDVRAGSVVKEYSKGLGQLLDIDFNRDGKHFVSSSDIADRNASDKTIVVWDFASQIPLSNQVYLEAYTCPCVRYHPFEKLFVAQSNGNYIAIFSGRPPFKMNKYSRFESHQVLGYRVQCNFSPDGGLLVSGSSDGRVYIYNHKSTRLLKVLDAHAHVCTDVTYHPSMPSVLASGGWDGNLCIFN